MATTGGRGGGEGGRVGTQMVPRWDKRAVGEGQQQRHVDVSDDLEDSSSSQHSGSEKKGEEGRNRKKVLATFEQGNERMPKYDTV